MTHSDSTAPAQPASRPGELIRFVSSPKEQGRLAVGFALMGVIGLVALVVGVVLIVSLQAWGFLAVAVIGALMALVGAVMWGNGRRAASLSGDDLIDLIVTEDGVITQGGFEIPWSEVSEVKAVQIVKNRIRTRDAEELAGRAIGEAAGKALFDLGGADIKIEIHLPDCKGALQRATTKMQKLALIDEIGGRAGYAHVALGTRTAEEMAPLREILARESAAHGVPFVHTEERVGATRA